MQALKEEPSPQQNEPSAPVPPGARRAVAWLLAATFFLSALLIFTRLGHYALWDDEAGSALGAKSVLQCGDTQAWVGHNLVAYRQGFVLNHLRTEGEPPFCAYFDAPFLKLLGENTWGARFPFALCGLATVALLCWWLWKWRASTLTTAVFCIALLCNVSFYLYSRQCHYYAPATFFFCAITYLYLHWNGDRRKLAALSLCAALLLSLNYSFYVALAVCVGADYLIWQRKTRSFRWADWAILTLPSLFMGLAILAWWNPFHTGLGKDLYGNTLSDRLCLFLWTLRDLNRCEMITLIFTPLAFWAAFVSKSAWLKRGLFAFALYMALETAISTQLVSDTIFANVRYYCVTLPLTIALGAFSLLELTARWRWNRWVTLAVAVAVFGTNVFNGGMFTREGLRCTIYSFVRELADPPLDPFTVAVDCVQKMVPEGASVWVTPNEMIPPMIFHAPQAVYGWVLDSKQPATGQYANMPPIFFEKREAPDYALAFGPYLQNATAVLAEFPNVFYEEVALLDVYWRPLFRPELFWRVFTHVTEFNPIYDGVHLLKKIQVPPPLKVDADTPANPAPEPTPGASGGSF